MIDPDTIAKVETLPDEIPGKVFDLPLERQLRALSKDFIFDNFQPHDIDGGSEVYDAREFMRLKTRVAELEMRLAKLENPDG